MGVNLTDQNQYMYQIFKRQEWCLISTETQVKIAIKAMKSGKAGGLNADMLKTMDVMNDIHFIEEYPGADME